jgi:hypothetical protein
LQIVILMFAAGTSLVVGSAAGLALSLTYLGAAAMTTPRCTSSALSVLPVLTASNVTSVTIATLPAGCGGATIKVTVDSGVTSGSGSAAVPGGGGSMTVPITAGPVLDANVEIDFVLEGP